MRTRFALLALLAVVVAGCGGQKTTKGSHVDIVGQVYLVHRDEVDAIWFAVYTDKTQSAKMLVKYADPNFRVEENQFVHVVGVVDQNLETPNILMWDPDPVVLASEATVVTQPLG